MRRFVDAARGHTTNTDVVQSRFAIDMERTEAAWERALASAYDWSMEDAADDLLEWASLLDYKFIVQQEGGRWRGREEQHDSSTPASAYLSHLLFYGKLGKSTGVEAFDKAYAAAMELLLEGGEYRDQQLTISETESIACTDAVRAAARVHLAHYPRDWDALPVLWQEFITGRDGSLAG